MKQKAFYDSTAWKYFRQYVLLFYSNNGNVQCSTCGKWYQIPNKFIQVGHYHKSDRHRSVCLEFNNVAPQCYTCNKYFSGRPDVMRNWLIEKHGLKAIELLDIKKNNFLKLDKFTLDLFKDQYKKLFNDLVREKGNPWKGENLLKKF